MKYTAPGRFRSVADFRDHLAEVCPELELVEDCGGRDGPLGQPAELFGRRVGNRWAIHPMEGWDGLDTGLPSAHTRRRWRRFGRSGAKLIWGGEAFAVQPEGRANPNQLHLAPGQDVAGGLASLREEVLAGHREVGESSEDLVLGLQLTHSGRFSRPEGRTMIPRLVEPHPVLARKFGLAEDHPLLSDAELEGIAESYVGAARLAREVGFDFVDLKACHGYLMHELLGARQRPGPYGGSFENRTRLFRGLVEAVRREAPGLGIGVRVSLADVAPHHADPDSGRGRPMEGERPWAHGFGIDAQDPGQFDLEEPFRFLNLLRELEVRAVNVTLGSPYYCPHLQRPASVPPSDGYQPPEDPLRSVARHLQVVRAARSACPELSYVGSGYSYLQQFIPNVAEREVGEGSVDFVGLGRSVLSYPELCRDALDGRPLDRKRICRTFSDCTTAPRNHLISGCYPLDDHYKRMPEFEALRDIKAAAKRK